jgi:hypothetical protein
MDKAIIRNGISHALSINASCRLRINSKTGVARAFARLTHAPTAASL